jgi:hypothetical protein
VLHRSRKGSWSRRVCESTVLLGMDCQGSDTGEGKGAQICEWDNVVINHPSFYVLALNI